MGSAPSKTYWRLCYRAGNLLRSLGTLIPLFARRKPLVAWIINCEVRHDCFTAFLSTRTVTFPVSFPTHFNLLQIIITRPCTRWDWISIPEAIRIAFAWATPNSGTESQTR